MEENSDPARDLAARLRGLRKRAWPNIELTQSQLAAALGVSAPLISSWEKQGSPTLPPEDRLAGYARVFATPRSVDGDRVQLMFDLTEGEERARLELERELRALREAAVGDTRAIDERTSAIPTPRAGVRDEPPSAGLWHFADGAPVTIVCGTLPPNLRANEAYTDEGSPDFVQLYTFADVDALIELYGHIRAANPASQVEFLRSSEVKQQNLTTHLVLLGGVDWNELVGEVIEALGVPVAQHERVEGEAEGAVVVHDGEQEGIFRPVLRGTGADKILVEDVAHFCRGRNPYNQRRVVTICNGQYGRGTYGIVRALTDPRFRDRNARYIRSRFSQEQTYSLLTRVRVVRGEVITPDWTRPDSILHEWSGGA